MNNFPQLSLWVRVIDILVCEDIDCLFVERKNSDTQKNAMTFSGLLNCFDGINGGKNGLIVFMTKNYKCRLLIKHLQDLKSRFYLNLPRE